MSTSAVRQRFFCTGISGELLPRVVTSILGSGNVDSDAFDPTSSRRLRCEEHRCHRGNSSYAHNVGRSNHRFDSLQLHGDGGGRKGIACVSRANMSTAMIMREEGGSDSAERTNTRPSIHPTIESMRSAREDYGSSVTVGFVPTMGALHEGHLSLIRAARSQNDVVVASIFVNPTQFGVGEDLDKYPRQLEKDVDLLSSIGVDHVFAPSSDAMYGKNHVSYVEPTGFENTMEGISRPSHFRGVATVVTKLFNIVRPTRAYFGQKDAVQCVLIRRIVDDLNMNVGVRIMDTVRERDGLAMSSRNAYLTSEQRSRATVLFRALCAAREVYESRFARGMEEVDAVDLREVVEGILETEPMISEVQYVSIDDMETMRPLTRVGGDGCIISLACILGTVRLIDNIVLI